MTHFVSAKLSYSMLVGGYKQSEGQGTDGDGIYGDYAAAVAESLH